MCNNLAKQKLIPYAFLSASSGTFSSLFKVLFIFPSWYLCAIGLELILSFRWNLPPTLRSNPEERDFQKTYRAQGAANDQRDSHPQRHSFPRGFHLHPCWQCIYRQHVEATGLDSQAELFLVHSPLLKESCLVSIPPLTYMLKFSGCASLNSCLGDKHVHQCTFWLIQVLQLNVIIRNMSSCCCCIARKYLMHQARRWHTITSKNSNM